MSDRFKIVSGEGPPPDVTCCPVCGEQWFTLTRDGKPGAVALDGTRNVSGYAGVLACNECGHQLDTDPPRPPLTIATQETK